MDYSPLEKLADELREKINTLKSGKMKPDEVSGLVSSARDVYERLVILEFQAHEKTENANKHSEVKPFKIETEEPDNQISIIDAIEEASQPEENVKNVAPVTQQIRIDIPEEEIVEEIEETVSVSAPEPTLEEKPEPLEKKEVDPKPTSAPEPIVNDELENPESLAEKFEHAPIEDISKSISLNEKFQFIRVLCENNSKTFEALLERINGCQDEALALKTFGALIPPPESDDAKEVYKKFEELIKRKF